MIILLDVSKGKGFSRSYFDHFILWRVIMSKSNSKLGTKIKMQFHEPELMPNKEFFKDMVRKLKCKKDVWNKTDLVTPTLQSTEQEFWDYIDGQTHLMAKLFDDMQIKSDNGMLSKDAFSDLFYGEYNEYVSCMKEAKTADDRVCCLNEFLYHLSPESFISELSAMGPDDYGLDTWVIPLLEKINFTDGVLVTYKTNSLFEGRLLKTTSKTFVMRDPETGILFSNSKFTNMKFK